MNTWSRRRFVTCGLVAAAAPALARASARHGIDLPPDLRARGAVAGAAAGTGSGEVRAAGPTDDRLTTAVHVDGAGPYRFLVDTGAERTLIADDVAARLALPRGRKVMVEGIIRTQPAVLVEIDRLDVGGFIRRRLEVPVLPRTMLRVDGYLGLDVLDHHRVIFDFRNRRLSVTRPQGFFSALWTGENEAVVHTLGSSGRLRATECLVDGVRTAAFLDTGAEVSVMNPALYAALRKRAPRRQAASLPVRLYGVTGGTVTGLAVVVDEIRLGALRWVNAPLVLAGLRVFDVWGLSRQPALFLGMNALRKFARVSIDYGRKELRFQEARARPRPTFEAALTPPLAG